MPYTDAEKQKEYDRERKRRRREKESLEVSKGFQEVQPPASPAAVATLPTYLIPTCKEKCSPDKTGHCAFCGRKCEDQDGNYIPAPDREPISQPKVIEDPYEVSEKTRKYLDSRGWVVWTCTKLNGDLVVIVRDDSITGFPPGLPVYTENELIYILNVPMTTLRLIHEAKKLNREVKLLPNQN